MIGRSFALVHTAKAAGAITVLDPGSLGATFRFKTNNRIEGQSFRDPKTIAAYRSFS